MSVKANASGSVGGTIGKPDMPPRTPLEIARGSLHSLQETHDVGDPYYREGWNRAIRRALQLLRTDSPSMAAHRVSQEVPHIEADAWIVDAPVRQRVHRGWKECVPHIVTILADVPE